MDKAIPHSTNPFPRNFRVAIPSGLGQVLYRFPDIFKALDHSILPYSCFHKHITPDGLLSDLWNQ